MHDRNTELNGAIAMAAILAIGAGMVAYGISRDAWVAGGSGIIAWVIAAIVFARN